MTGAVRPVRPKAALYMAVGQFLAKTPFYWDMDKTKMITKIMEEGGGRMNPHTVSVVVDELIDEAIGPTDGDEG